MTRYTYELRYDTSMGFGPSLLSFGLTTWETEAEARARAEEAIDWYVERAFKAASRDGFVIEVQKRYTLG